MKKKNLKKLIALLVLALVLAGLIIGSVLLKNMNETEEEGGETKDNSVVIFDKGSAIATAIHFKTAENEMSFSYVNEDWVYDGDKNFPLDQDSVAAMAQSVGKVSASFTLENVSDDLSDYGLTKPSVTVDAKFSDGTEKTFIFGDTNAFNSCIYFMIKGDEAVYMVEEALAEPFAADLDYLYEPEIYTLQKEGITYDEVSSITLTTVSEEKGEITNEIKDDEGVYDLFELIYTLDLADYEDYYADSEEMKSSYGISPEGERYTVNYTVEDEAKSYTVYIGHKFEAAPEESETTDSAETTAAEEEAKHCYFYTFEGSSVVYTADGDTIDEIFTYLTYTPKTDVTTEITTEN